MTALILGFDTSAAHCAAALLSGDDIVASTALDLPRGQGEALIPLLEYVLAQADAAWSDLTAIGVGTGPGNFTGIRISVSAARGLALGLSVPAVGVTGFEARAICAPANALVCIPAPRGQVYVAPPGDAPRVLALADAEALAADLGLSLHGTCPPADLAGAIARCAASRSPEMTQPPAPLYLRPADAAPARDTPPPLLD